MADPSPPSTPSSSSPQRRRSSITELFTSRPVLNTSVSPSPSPTIAPSAVSPAQPRKGMSIATLGLGGGSPTAGSPFTAFAKQRRTSAATSSASGSPEFRNNLSEEPAVLEEGDSPTIPLNPPGSPSFARRMSFGAQALRDVKQGGSPGGGEGFNWSDALRDKTKRSTSFSSTVNPFAGGLARNRSASSGTTAPPKEMPKPAAPPPQMKKPDHMGERMLRGDFMID